MKGGYVEISVYLACVSFIINIYANFITLLGVLAHFVLFILVSCGCFGILWRYHIPKPGDSSFRRIFGRNWGAYAVDDVEKKNDDDYIMNVVAHRACGLDAPENSLSALKIVHNEGITAVEFDVLMTSDNVPVVFHDLSLSRMTNLAEYVSEITYEEIQNLDISVKHPFGRNFQGEKIPTLYEYVTFCLENNIRMFIDLKGLHANIAQIINDLYKQYPKLYDMSVVSSFNPLLIYKIRAKDPKITCSLAWRPYYYSHEEFSARGPARPRTNNFCQLMTLRILNVVHQWALWKFGYYVLGLSALLLHKDMVTSEMVHYWNKRGIRVIAWSVNLPTEKQYFEKILAITYLTDTAINS